MTRLRHVPSDLGYEAFPSLHDDVLAPLYRLAPAQRFTFTTPRRSPPIGTVLFAAFGLIETLRQRWRDGIQARRDRDHLCELDDHLLRDIGLTRADIHLVNISPFAQLRQSHHKE